MRITSFSDYAFRVLMFLAVRGGERTTIADIATSYEISHNHLTKVVQALARAGMVRTVRGKGGGLFLARPPTEIRLGDVVRACEDEHAYVECLIKGHTCCKVTPACGLVGYLGGAFGAFYAELNRHTLADLVAPERVHTLRPLLRMEP